MAGTLDALRLKAEAMAVTRDFGPEAISTNREILELDESNQGAYTRLARCFLEAGKIDAAREMCEQVLAITPKNIIAANMLREVKQKTKQGRCTNIVNGITTFDEAFSVGLAARRSRDNDLAILALTKALEFRPDSVYALNVLGSAYRDKGQLKLAGQTFEKGLLLKRNDVSLVGLAAVRRDGGNLGQAESLYEEALKNDPRNPYALNGMGGVCSDRRQHRRAEEYFEQASASDKGRSDARKGLLDLQKHYMASGDAGGVERLDSIIKSLGYHALDPNKR